MGRKALERRVPGQRIPQKSQAQNRLAILGRCSENVQSIFNWI